MRALRMVVCLCASCSFASARVPKQLPAPADCPGATIAIDAIGSTLVVASVVALAVSGGSNGEGVPWILVGVPMGVTGGAYLASAMYGASARSRCQELQAQELAAQQEHERQGARREHRVRKSATGEAPLHCALTERDVGACFSDGDACAKEAARHGGACEERTNGWCFDVQHITQLRSETSCAASQVDCDARRTMYLTDRAFTVTTCSAYSVASPR